jgi:hypothetical protein
MKEGQSIEDAIAHQQGSPLPFFLHVLLPTHLARHDEKGVYGSSVLTVRGPAPAPAGQ